MTLFFTSLAGELPILWTGKMGWAEGTKNIFLSDFLIFQCSKSTKFIY